MENTETNRRDWRELLYTAPGLSDAISGCIMFEETLYQSTAAGKPFVDVLRSAGIVPGIKVDAGLQARPATGSPASSAPCVCFSLCHALLGKPSLCHALLGKTKSCTKTQRLRKCCETSSKCPSSQGAWRR